MVEQTADGLKFSEKINVAIIQVSMSITEEDIESVIVTAFEGGINYWAGLDISNEMWKERPRDEPFSTWATKLLLEGKELKLWDIEQTEDDTAWLLSLSDLIVGIQKEISINPDHVDPDTWDADVADNMIQYALFGKIVFG